MFIARAYTIFLISALALSSAGCKHHWNFSRHETSSFRGVASTMPAENGFSIKAETSRTPESPAVVTASSPTRDVATSASPTRPPVASSDATSPPTQSQPPSAQVGQSPVRFYPNTGRFLEQAQAVPVEPLPPIGNQAGKLYDPVPLTQPSDSSVKPDPVTVQGSPCESVHEAQCFPRLRSYLREAIPDVISDHRNFYTCNTLRDLSISVMLMAPVANTQMDENFIRWQNNDFRTEGVDKVASFFKVFGDGRIFVPAFATLAVLGHCYRDAPLLGCSGDYCDRVTRAFLLGAPPMLFMQVALGAGRPLEAGKGSQWTPFQNTNAVSGHGFMGAIPFITAAQMTDRPLLKGMLYFCSTLPTWSRVNDNDHYLSQAILGWYMAYLTCRAVNETEMEKRNRRYHVIPIMTPNMTGIAIGMEY